MRCGWKSAGLHGQGVRTELVMERAKAKVVKHFRKVYADREAESETGFATIFKPVMPAPLLQHSYASASVVTDVLAKKYVDAMPLYRQEQMWKRMGINLKRGTMANWVMLVADTYFRLFWQRTKEELLTQSVIHADETVLQVLKKENRSATADSRMNTCKNNAPLILSRTGLLSAYKKGGRHGPAAFCVGSGSVHETSLCFNSQSKTHLKRMNLMIKTIKENKLSIYRDFLRTTLT